MKKLLCLAALAVCCALHAEHDGIFQLSFIAPGQLPSATSRIYGARLSLIWGECRELRGLDLGIAGYLQDDMYGLQTGLFQITGKDLYGWQCTLVNTVDNDVYGLQTALGNMCFLSAYGCQLGLVNYADSMKGLQLGLWNQTSSLSGCQIGLVNWASNSIVPVLPFINVAF